MSIFWGLQITRPSGNAILGDAALTAFAAGIALLILSALGKNPSQTLAEPGFFGLCAGTFAGALASSTGLGSSKNGLKGKLALSMTCVTLAVLLSAVVHVFL